MTPVTAVAAGGPTTRSLRLGLLVLGLSLLLLAFLDLVLLSSSENAPFHVLALFVVEGVLWCTTGLIAWSRRPSNRTGLLLVGGGCAFLVSALGNVPQRPIAAVGALLASLPLALNVHLLMAFPSGRLRGRGILALVVVIYVLAGLGPLPQRLFTPGGPAFIADLPGLAQVSETAARLGRVVSIGVAAVLLARLRGTPPAQRRTLGPLYLYGAVALVAVSFAAQLQEAAGISTDLRFSLQVAALAVIPVAFTAVLLRGGFARAGAVEEMSLLLSNEQAPTQDVLAAVLGDSSLTLLHWLPDEQTWVDGDGQLCDLPRADARHGVVEVTAGPRLLGAITYDALLLPDADLVRLAARPAGLALEAERLSVELRRSRARLVATADDERRRLAGNLHDGLQVRLVLLALQAGTLAASATDPTTAQAFADLRREADEAAAELRRTVHALLPAALVERGLAPAVEDLVDRLPLRSSLVVRQVPGDLRVDVVTAAWYVVTESVSNALKHADASRLDVELGTADGRLVVIVDDDGAGGATLVGGTGLRGLVDRLDVVGGLLHLDSPLGRGTRVRAEIPCPA